MTNLLAGLLACLGKIISDLALPSMAGFFPCPCWRLRKERFELPRGGLEGVCVLMLGLGASPGS